MNYETLSIILIYRSAGEIPQIFDKYIIKVLVAPNIEHHKSVYGDTIQLYIDLRHYEKLETSYNLSYEQIEQYRATQVKIEHGLQRQYSDMGVIQQLYYNALGYWLKIFEMKIDALIFCGINHSSPIDCLPIDISISKNIPTFNIATTLGFNNNFIMQASCLNTKTFINTPTSTNSKELYRFIEQLQEYYKQRLDNKNKLCFKHPLKFFLKNQVLTFPHFIYNIFAFNKRSFKADFVIEKQEKFVSATFVKKLKRYYDKISESPSPNENYIYYSLHQEPEASIMATTTLNSQLLIIQWISEYLPKGWKLYIKEHPNQFFVYDEHDYFLKNIHFYRSPMFYKQIKSLPNTRLIDINISSKLLIQNARAICSICGSALLEGVIYHKPIIIFGNNTLFLELLKESFAITSKTQLKHAIDKIIEGGGVYSYSDFDVIVSQFTKLCNHLNYKENIEHFISSIYYTLQSH
ncbi:hypothetical protein [Helicobacter rodentium]|uniref:hypothetical protein n=1 Tax=Helicobacter rodentium TaxID=59617 RepID=UPI00235240B4|nr:hypothetical protein [Helicobacter rodentium]